MSASIPVISTFKQNPDRGRALSRDFRVRWALEEIGQPYELEFVTFPELKDEAYRKQNPFGQIPSYQQDGLVLFESGSILLHLAQKYDKLVPADPKAHARVLTWLFAAVSTVEPPIVERSMAFLFDKEKTYYDERNKVLDQRIHTRLEELSNYLRKSEWLEGEFSIADILMIHVIRRIESLELLEQHPIIKAYVERGKARPAYQRAFEAQLRSSGTQ